MGVLLIIAAPTLRRVRQGSRVLGSEVELSATLHCPHHAPQPQRLHTTATWSLVVRTTASPRFLHLFLIAYLLIYDEQVGDLIESYTVL